jgi:hypothetical protein
VILHGKWEISFTVISQSQDFVLSFGVQRRDFEKPVKDPLWFLAIIDLCAITAHISQDIHDASLAKSLNLRR